MVESNRAIIVDAYESEDQAVWLKKNGICVDYVILTHEHYDHISGVNWIKNRLKVPVCCSKDCDEGLKNPRINGSHYFEASSMMQSWMPNQKRIHIEDYVCRADVTFEKSYTLNWIGHRIEMKSTPGHSKGSICINVDGKLLFPGDTMFLDFETTTGFPGGSKNELSSITKPYLKTLPKDILVFPGHFTPFIMKNYKFL